LQKDSPSVNKLRELTAILAFNKTSSQKLVMLELTCTLDVQLQEKIAFKSFQIYVIDQSNVVKAKQNEH
jgi:hypothetical protein